MFECASCYDEFYYREDCDDHMNIYGHWAECQTCTREFRSIPAAHQHMNATDHWSFRYACETCDNLYTSQQAASQHMEAEGHWKNYCKPCDRQFDSENNFRQHLHSRVHQGNNIPCPFCRTGFTTATGLSHHLETGSCSRAPALNRETILAMIRKRDPNGIITNKMLSGPTPTYSASDQAWNGDFWECYLCHNEFRSKRALDQHLSSPTHQQKVYHCPNGGCRKQFSALAQMFNHLESESCRFMRFERVQQHVKEVLTSSRMIAF